MNGFDLNKIQQFIQDGLTKPAIDYRKPLTVALSQVKEDDCKLVLQHGNDLCVELDLLRHRYSVSCGVMKRAPRGPFNAYITNNDGARRVRV